MLVHEGRSQDHWDFHSFSDVDGRSVDQVSKAQAQLDSARQRNSLSFCNTKRRQPDVRAEVLQQSVRQKVLSDEFGTCTCVKGDEGRSHQIWQHTNRTRANLLRGLEDAQKSLFGYGFLFCDWNDHVELGTLLEANFMALKMV